MKNEDSGEKKTWKARLKVAVAGLALAGALAGGAVAVADTDPVPAEDTTETALSFNFRSMARGVSWQ